MYGRTSICTLSIVRCRLPGKALGQASCEGPVPFAVLQAMSELRDTLLRLAGEAHCIPLLVAIHVAL